MLQCLLDDTVNQIGETAMFLAGASGQQTPFFGGQSEDNSGGEWEILRHSQTSCWDICCEHNPVSEVRDVLKRTIEVAKQDIEGSKIGQLTSESLCRPKSALTSQKSSVILSSGLYEFHLCRFLALN